MWDSVSGCRNVAGNKDKQNTQLHEAYTSIGEISIISNSYDRAAKQELATPNLQEFKNQEN